MGQPSIPPTPSGTSLEGKTILITGGNSGIGLEAARQFLALKASRVIITCRNKSKGEAAVATLRGYQTTKSSAAVIDVFDLDLDDYQSVLRFCDKVKKDVPYLDILVCNGGVTLSDYQTSKSGHERTMQVNCYSNFLLVLELLPLLRATSTARKTPSYATFTGSYMQTRTSLSASQNALTSTETVFSHFDKKENFSMFTHYADSKLLVNAFVRRLATLVSSSDVVVNNFCPGMVATGFNRNMARWIRVIMKLAHAWGARTVEEGARTLIYATAVVGEETHGKFLANNVITANPWLDGDAGKEFIERLWTDVVGEMVALDQDLKCWI